MIWMSTVCSWRRMVIVMTPMLDWMSSVMLRPHIRISWCWIRGACWLFLLFILASPLVIFIDMLRSIRTLRWVGW